jgi:hypothetical protein
LLPGHTAPMFCAMRFALFAVLAMTALPATAEDRFAADNPWFRDFEAACRVDTGDMTEDCQAGVLGAYADFAETTDITCDFAKFWRVRDELKSDLFDVLPWQYGVEAIVQTEGVCEAK